MSIDLQVESAAVVLNPKNGGADSTISGHRMDIAGLQSEVNEMRRNSKFNYN